MNHSPVFVLFCMMLTTLAALNILAHYFSLYWIYPWLDIPAHFFGGLIVAFGYWAWRERRKLPQPGFRRTLLVVLLAGATIEMLEVLANTPTEAIWFSDTALDFVMDAVGGAVGYLAARRIATLS